MKFLLAISFLFMTSISFAQEDNGTLTTRRPNPGQGGGNPGRVPMPPRPDTTISPLINLTCNFYLHSYDFSFYVNEEIKVSTDAKSPYIIELDKYKLDFSLNGSYAEKYVVIYAFKDGDQTLSRIRNDIYLNKNDKLTYSTTNTLEKDLYLSIDCINE